MPKKLSIITVCFNEKEIERTCQSVINQTWQDFEWIVIDGRSDSWCTDILERYREHMAYYVSEKDNGIYDAMNKGISHAAGEYLLFMNSGDLFFSCKALEKVSAYFNKNIDILYGDVVLKMNDSHYMYKILPSEINDSFFIGDCLTHQASYIKTELFKKHGQYNTEYKIFSDCDKWIHFIQAGCSFEHLPFLCTIYDCSGISSQMTPEHSVERTEILQKYFSATALENTTSAPAPKYCNVNPYVQNTRASPLGLVDAPEAIAITSEKNIPKKPEISVIVPVFNMELYLNECIDSLLAQNHSNLEIICVNDGSYDSSLDILKDYAKKDARIRVYSFEENIGVATCRNYALSKAQGEYISFIDSDDWISVDFYEKLYKCAKNGDYDLVKGEFYFAYNDGTSELESNHVKIKNCIEQNKFIGLGFQSDFSTALYRQSFLQKFHVKFPLLVNAEDTVFLLNVLLHKPKFSLVEDTFYYYRQLPRSAHHSYAMANIHSTLKNFVIQCTLLNESELSQSDYMEYYCKCLYAGALTYYKDVVFLKLTDHEHILCLQHIYDLIKSCKYSAELIKLPTYSFLEKLINVDPITTSDLLLFLKESHIGHRNFMFSYYKYKLRYKLAKGEKRRYYKHKYLICKKIRKLRQNVERGLT